MVALVAVPFSSDPGGGSLDDSGGAVVALSLDSVGRPAGNGCGGAFTIF